MLGRVDCPQTDTHRLILQALLCCSSSVNALLITVRRRLEGVVAAGELGELAPLLFAYLERDQPQTAESTHNIRWRSLMIVEHLFLHTKPFRVRFLKDVHQFLRKVFSCSDIIAERSLITLGRFINKFGGDPDLALLRLLPQHIEKVYHLRIGDDPYYLHKQSILASLQILHLEFKSKTDYISDVLFELDSCFQLLIPSADHYRRLYSLLVDDQSSSALLIDEFGESGDEKYNDEFESPIQSDTDQDQYDEGDEEELQWQGGGIADRAPISTNYEVVVALNRDMSNSETGENHVLFIFVRDSYRILIKSIRPELERWRSLLHSAKKVATRSVTSKDRFWGRTTHIAYGVVSSQRVRVGEAIRKCEILLGLLDVPDKSTGSRSVAPVQLLSSSAAPSSTLQSSSAASTSLTAQQSNIAVAKPRKTSTARERIHKRLKRR